jgi:hypothetical protein
MIHGFNNRQKKHLCVYNSRVVRAKKMSLPVVGLPEELHPNSHGEFGFEGRAIALVVDRWGPLGDLLWLEGDCSHEKTGWWFQTGFIFIYFPQYMGKFFPLTISIIFQDA